MQTTHHTDAPAERPLRTLPPFRTMDNKHVMYGGATQIRDALHGPETVT
jgi:hypothetical protein